ncbi:MAG TPA: hypothetical protein VFW07_28495 [Parafilimonas sp.]|nr:hypothetical protein [Parafilimonas sp.]
MRNKKRVIFTIVIAIILAAAVYAYNIWNKPARDVAEEKGIQITAVAIFDSFTNNETSADSQFLNKAIEVTGIVSDVKKNQAGKTVIYLKSDDPIFGVNCTFKEDPGPIAKGSTITFKGICTGYLSDVVINEGIMIK